MSQFTILLNGPVTLTRPVLHGPVGTRSRVAADGGMAHAAPLGLDVELSIGDFDSVLQKSWPPVTVTFPVRDFPLPRTKLMAKLAAEAAIAGAPPPCSSSAVSAASRIHALGHFALALRLAPHKCSPDSEQRRGRGLSRL